MITYRTMKKAYLIIGILCCLVTAIGCKQNKTSLPFYERELAAVDSVDFPKPLGFVSDYEFVFTPPQKQALEKFLATYEDTTSREIAVLTIDTLNQFENIDDYTNALGNYWGVGKKDKNNGLLIVMSLKHRKIRISTGYGVENMLTDSICKQVIDSVIIPQFVEDAYYEGIKAGIDSLLVRWK